MGSEDASSRHPGNAHLRITPRESVVVEHPASEDFCAFGRDLPDNLIGRKLFSDALGLYLRRCFARHQPTTKRKVLQAFRLLWDFLDYEAVVIGREYLTWDEVDDGLLTRLIAWMSNPDCGVRLTMPTKAAKYNTVRAFFEWLKDDPQYLPADWIVRKNPWPLSYKHIKSRSVLTEADLGPIVRAAVVEVEALIVKWARTDLIITDPSIVVPPPEAKISKYKQTDVALKTLATAFPLPPGRHAIKPLRYGLYQAFRSYPQVRYIDALEGIVPTQRSLVPFVVLITIATLVNPDTVRSLRWSDIQQEHPVFGSDRWRLHGEKRRAGGRQVRSFPAKVKDLTNPIELLRILKARTERIRSALPVDKNDFVFTFVSEHTGVPSTFASKDTGTWSGALSRFISENELTPFTLAQLRPTGSDLVDEITDGDLVAQQTLLNHARADTTRRSYQSDAARVRMQEKLTEAMAWRERYVRSGGLSDSRGSLGNSSAATPGYECFDPYDSPIVGQVTGRVCSAYGVCPMCPLHALNFRSATSLGRVLQLSERIDEAKDVVAAPRWLMQWMPVRKAVATQLQIFPEAIYVEARRLQLPPIPEIE